MEDFAVYLKTSDVTCEELVLLEGLVDFYLMDKNCDLDVVKGNLMLLKGKLSPSFFSLVSKKIEVIEREKFIDVVYTFLECDYKSYDEFECVFGMSVDDFRSFLEKYEHFYKSSVLTDKVVEKLNLLVVQENKERISKIKLYDYFLYLFLNSRFHASNIRALTGIGAMEFLRGINDDDLKDNYPVDIEMVVKEKVDMLTKLRVNRRSDLLPVREIELVSIVKPDVLRVSSKDYKRLELVSDFLKNYGNFDRMSTKYKYNYNVLYSMIDLDYLEDFLKEDIYLKVSNYLDLSYELSCVSISQRKETVKSMLRKYYMVNGNIIKLIVSGESEEKVLRLLSDSLVDRFVSNNERDVILSSLDDYSRKESVVKLLKKKQSD